MVRNNPKRKIYIFKTLSMPRKIQFLVTLLLLIATHSIHAQLSFTKTDFTQGFGSGTQSVAIVPCMFCE